MCLFKILSSLHWPNILICAQSSLSWISVTCNKKIPTDIASLITSEEQMLALPATTDCCLNLLPHLLSVLLASHSCLYFNSCIIQKECQTVCMLSHPGLKIISLSWMWSGMSREEKPFFPGPRSQERAGLVELQTLDKDSPPGTRGWRVGCMGCRPWQSHLLGAQTSQLGWGAGTKCHGPASSLGAAVALWRGFWASKVSARGVPSCPVQSKGC